MLSPTRRILMLMIQPVGYRTLRRLSNLVDSKVVLELPKNEPILNYRDNLKSDHKLELDKQIAELSSNELEIPIIIAGRRYEGLGEWHDQVIPFDHKHKLARFRYADPNLIRYAIDEIDKFKMDWITEWSLDDRCRLFEKAALLAKTKYRQKLNAATILGQGKTVDQAEIDSAAELVDFLQMNAFYARHLETLSQPLSPNINQSINTIDMRPLDGFVAAISPFNFTAIGSNLASAPTIMGNSVLWKPSDSSILANYITMQLFEEAGFPEHVINFIPADGYLFGRTITSHPKLGGINFTGSMATFSWLYNEVGINIRRYKCFPRLSGECGGKNFHFVHNSADPELVISQTIRSAFEYSGQKCSACSRLYVPSSLWKTSIRDLLLDTVKSKIKIGPATNLDTNFSAVIDRKSFEKCEDYLNYAKSNKDELAILVGGSTNDEEGFYVEPTVIETTNPKNRLMEEEIFGPILTVYVYPDNKLDDVIDLLDQTSKFALTGSIFSNDKEFISILKKRLIMTAGNLYINDKSTGAIVGQQPFGGSRLSGTNDKPGGIHNLMRWCNQRTIKETLKPQSKWSFL